MGNSDKSWITNVKLFNWNKFCQIAPQYTEILFAQSS